MRIEDCAAAELEEQGYIVIRTYQAGCPDLIAFQPEIAPYVLAREIKSSGDNVRDSQAAFVAVLKEKGVDAEIDFFEERNHDREQKITRHKEARLNRLREEKRWFLLGVEAFKEDIPRSCCPDTSTAAGIPRSVARATWTVGWDRAKANDVQSTLDMYDKFEKAV